VESSVSFFADHPDQILRQHEMEMVWYRQGQSALFQQQQQQQLVVDHLPPSGSANNARYSVARLAFQNAAQLAHQNQRYHAEKIYREYHDKSIESPSVSSSSTLPPKVASSAVAVTTTDSSSSGNVGSSNSNNNLQTTKIIPPKYQYYQSDKYMTIAILEAKVQESDLQVDFRGSDDDDDATTIIAIHLRKQGQVFPVVAGTLCERIIAEQSKIQIKDEKVLVKLVKATPGKEWHDLLDTHRNKNKTKSSSKLTTPVATSTSTATALDNNNNHHPVQQATTTSSAATTSKNEKNQRPYASHKDWDRIEKEVLQEEESEKPQGDDALNKLFQQIYANADPDTRRAMIKSYQTSGGTCLSTNWKEVQSKDYEQQRTAPKGMEWKNWEGEKLPMESDDDGDD
jgi:suppressor of G2 allele of SKP1